MHQFRREGGRAKVNVIPPSTLLNPICQTRREIQSRNAAAAARNKPGGSNSSLCCIDFFLFSRETILIKMQRRKSARTHPRARCNEAPLCPVLLVGPFGSPSLSLLHKSVPPHSASRRRRPPDCTLWKCTALSPHSKRAAIDRQASPPSFST